MFIEQFLLHGSNAWVQYHGLDIHERDFFHHHRVVNRIHRILAPRERTVTIDHHAGYGIYIHATGRPNPFQYAYRNNWLYWLQRWSGIVALVFIGWHFWQTRLANYLYGRVIEFQMMVDILSDPAWLAFYVVGLIAVSYHLANGLRGFLLTWGAVVGDRARRRATVVCAVFGVLVLVLSLATLGAFLR